MSSYSDLASISSAIENLELGDTFHDQDEEISVEDPSIGAEAVCVEDPGIGDNGHCYVSSDGHDHVRNNNRFLDPESRAKAISLIKHNVAPRKMKKEIDVSNLVSLSTRQLNNLKQREGRKLSGKISCTLSEFLLWVEQRTQIPDDDDEVYVVSYVYEVSKTDPTKIKTMTCFLTTKRLAKLALLSEFSLIGTLLFLNWQFTSLLIKTAMHIHCDGTYKLIWQGHDKTMAPIRRMHQQE